MWSGAFGPAHVRPDVRREVATRAGVQRRLERDRHRQRPHGVALGLLLEGDGQDPLVDAGRDELAGDDRRRAADRARGVHPEQRLARRRRGRRRGTARASSRPRRSRAPCRRRRRRCRSRSSRHRRAPGSRPPARGRPSTRRRASALCFVWPMPTIATRFWCDPSALPSRTATRFCCRHGPLVAWATARLDVAVDDALRRLAEADQPGGHDRVGAQRAARRVDVDVAVEAERRPQEHLLVA